MKTWCSGPKPRDKPRESSKAQKWSSSRHSVSVVRDRRPEGRRLQQCGPQTGYIIMNLRARRHARRTGVRRSPCRGCGASRSASSHCSVFKDRVPRRHVVALSGRLGGALPPGGNCRENEYPTLRPFTHQQGLPSIGETAGDCNRSALIRHDAKLVHASGLQKRLGSIPRDGPVSTWVVEASHGALL